MTSQHQSQLASAAVESALNALQNPSWEVRVGAVRALASHVHDPAVFKALVARFDDEDTAVGTEAADVLVMHAGLNGLRAVVDRLISHDDNLALHVQDRLRDLATDGAPIAAQLTAMRASETRPDVVDEINDLIAEI